MEETQSSDKNSRGQPESLKADADRKGLPPPASGQNREQMDSKWSSALIATITSLAVAVIGSYSTMAKVNLELQEAETSFVRGAEGGRIAKILDCRLEEYPKLTPLLGELSQTNRELTPAVGQDVGRRINEWFYSRGGLCAHASTRGAVLQLRNVLLEWNSGPRPPNIKEYKDDVTLLIRNDLGLAGRRIYDRVGLDDFITLVKNGAEEARMAAKE